jgi:hypothetical protein
LRTWMILTSHIFYFQLRSPLGQNN